MMRALYFAATSFAWCFLTCAGMASVNALGYFLTVNANTSLPLRDFWLYFSNTCGILLAATLCAWLFLAFFMVWLGGVRSGMALFFMLFFFVAFDYLAMVLDLVLSHVDKYQPYWLVLMNYFFRAALLLAAIGSLVLGKISRRIRPISLSLRLYTVAAVLLTGLAFSVWLRIVHSPDLNAFLFWGAFAAASVVMASLLWRLGRTSRGLGVVLVLMLILVFAALPLNISETASASTPAASSAAAPHTIKHVILITVDTLRRDAVPPYSPDATACPHINLFAGDSAVFMNAFASSPWTYPSVASILTGLAPRVHHLTDGKSALPKAAPTLAESMKNAGYHTAAIGFNAMLLPRSGLNKGFQEYCWYPESVVQFNTFGVGLAHNIMDLCGTKKPSADQLTDHAVQWLSNNAQQDFFLWLHYFDPHMPYRPPEAFQPADPALRELGGSFEETRAARMGSVARTEKERAWIRALYAGEVRYMDAQLGRLFETLRKLNLYDDTLIVFTSDHGEELWDHGLFEHGHTLYNELVGIPLMIKTPGDNDTITVDTFVSNQAIMPTVLDLCGVPSPDNGILLPPLSPLIQGRPGDFPAAPVHIGASIFHDHLEGVIFDNMKYIYGVLSGHEQLFHLKDDPEERAPVTGHATEYLERGRQLLNDARTADAQMIERLGIIQEEGDRLNHEAIRSLQALGYL